MRDKFYKFSFFGDSTSFEILETLRGGGLSSRELAPLITTVPSHHVLKLYLWNLETLGLLVREYTGRSERWWLQKEKILSLSHRLSKCVEHASEKERLFSCNLSAEAEEILKRRKLFGSEYRISILKEIIASPRDIEYLYQTIKPCVKRRSILSALHLFETAGLVRSERIPVAFHRSAMIKLIFQATPLGHEINAILLKSTA